jgi:hypothetical protein
MDRRVQYLKSYSVNIYFYVDEMEISGAQNI